jgi:outer membrane protein assembly factor BamB
VALDKRTGQLKYKVGNDLASYSSPIVRRLGNRDTGLAFLRSGLLGWDVESGQELFTYPWRAEMLESVNAAQPIVSSNQILISETYAIGSVLLELAGDAPSVVWKDGDRRSTQSFRAHWSTPVLIDGYLYGCSGRNQPDADFRCVRLSDAKVMWTQRRHERASVLAVDGYLVVLYENGELELIRPNTEKYEKVASVHLGEINGSNGLPLLDDPCWAAPVLSHGLLYVRGQSNLLCFELIPTP